MADLITHLVTHGIVGFLAMDTAVQHMRKVGGRLSSSILETANIEPQILLESISSFYSLDYASDKLLLSIDPDVPQFWRHDNALRLGAIPLALDASGLTLGVLEPLSQFHLEEVKEEYGSNIRQLLLLEFRFFELCNRFFDVVLEQRYAIWASKFPLQEEPRDKESTSEHDILIVDDADGEALFDATSAAELSDATTSPAREQTTESTDTVDDHTLETDRTDAEDTDNLPPLAEDPSHILTGPRDALDLLGHEESFEAAFAASDDALFLVDPANAASSDTQDVPVLREHTPAHSQTISHEELPLDDTASAARRGKEPSMPSIRVRSSESKPGIRAALHTPSRIETTDAEEPAEQDSGLIRGREPFPSTKQPTQVSGAFRIGYPAQRTAFQPLVASESIARKLHLIDGNGSWQQTDAIMNALSDQDSSNEPTITSVDIRAIYKDAKRVDELLHPTLTYFGAFFERRFLMHFWQPNRSTGLLMQGVREHSTAFTRIEVPYDESSGVHKMRVTGNYLQGSPIDIGFLTLYTRLGISTAKEAIAMPVYVDQEVVMMLLMDNGPDRPLDDTLVASEIALILQQLGRELHQLAEQHDRRVEYATPIEGEPSAGSLDKSKPPTLSTAAPLIPPELLDDVELPPAASDDLEIEMDSMQMDPIESDEDDLTLDSIEEFFGPKFQATSSKSATNEGSDSFEIAISTDQELSPAAKALLEQDTRRDDKRAVSIIVGDDERSDADIAYDLIPPTPSDLIRPPAPKDESADADADKNERVSRTTARHHALSGHSQYEDDAKNPPPSTRAAKPSVQPRAQWNARDLARLLRVGSAEFPLPKDEKTSSEPLRDTQEQPPEPQRENEPLQDTQEQPPDPTLQDTQEQQPEPEDEPERESESIEDAQEQPPAQTLQDTQEHAHGDDPQPTEAFSPSAHDHAVLRDEKNVSIQEVKGDPPADSGDLTRMESRPTDEPPRAKIDLESTADKPATHGSVSNDVPHPSSATESADDRVSTPPIDVDEDAAEQLRKILQERQVAKARQRQRAKTRLESTVESTESRGTSSVSDLQEVENDGPDDTVMFSPEVVQTSSMTPERRTQKTHVVAPRAIPAREIVTVKEDSSPPPAPISTSHEIDLDAVLQEVDQTAQPAHVDQLAKEVAKTLPTTAQEGPAASLVRLVELTESQRRMGTAAIKPLSLAMETLLRGNKEDRPAALQELIQTPIEALPDIHSEFPGPLELDRTDPEQALRPLQEHGPLLALIDARLYDFVPQLWACLERRSADARYYALRFLSLIRNLERRFVLVETAVDTDPQIRELALRNIETFRNSPDFLLALENFRDRLEDPDTSIRSYAIDALVKLRDHDAISFLIERLDDSDPAVRAHAHRGLQRLTFIDHGTTADAWEQWRAMHGRELPEQWLVDAMDAVEPIRRALAARALENLTGLVVNYHPDMSQQGLLRAKMAVERHFGLRR